MKKKKQLKKLPSLEYKFIDSPDNQFKIDKAYDILFEEMEKNMHEQIFKLAKENDLSLDEAEDIQGFAEASGLDPKEAFKIWQNS